MAIFVGKGPISGKEGDVVYARNRYGTYTRPLRIPVNPRSNLQSTVRAAFATISDLWQRLDDDQREGWTSYAKAIKIQNRVGQDITLTGHAMFVRCNVPRAAYVSPPAIITTPPSSMTMAILGTPTLTFNAGKFTVVPANDDDWTDTGGYLFVYATAPCQPTRTFPAGPFVHVATIQGNDTPMEFDYPWQLGANKTFIRFRASAPDGRLSPDIVFAFHET